jgi:hypothetical protein
VDLMTDERQFDLARNPVGDHRKRFILVCARCGVAATVNSNKTSSLPSGVVRGKFVERGWFVGQDNKHDLCPSHVKHPPKPIRDPELPLVERIEKSIQVLEQGLGEFLQLDHPRHHEKVVAMLSGFHERVFGSPAS